MATLMVPPPHCPCAKTAADPAGQPLREALAAHPAPGNAGQRLRGVAERAQVGLQASARDSQCRQQRQHAFVVVNGSELSGMTGPAAMGLESLR